MKLMRAQWRFWLLSALLGICMTGLGARLAFLHLGEHSGLVERIRKIRRYEQELVVSRGGILDRNGVPLAQDLTVKNVCADPQRINEKGLTFFIEKQLGRVLGTDPADTHKRLQRFKSRFQYIKKAVDLDTADQIAAMKLPGVFFEETSKRIYPNGGLMNHVVGFSNAEGVGSAGVELQKNSYLKGVPGLRLSQKDGRRHEMYMRRMMDIEPQEGADIYLTLDATIQFMVERALKKAMEKNQAEGGWVIVQRVKTGEILAMASAPSFDLNEYGRSTPEEQLNRCIGYTYEPGSTFKVVIVAGALNDGIVSATDSFNCENGCWVYNGKPLRDYHPSGVLSVSDIIKHSSNIGAAKVAVAMGERRVYNYLRKFGFGEKTGVELPGEEVGILHSPKRWDGITITRIAMGHAITVTALQMLNAVSAIANDGMLMRPQVISKIVDRERRVVYQAVPEAIRQVIRPDTAKTMRGIMAGVTEQGGTGRRSRIDGYRVGGKTGTAQKVINGRYSNKANMASFVGFFPVEDPQISMIVVVDNPQPLHSGGAVSAPVFSEIGTELVRYLASRSPEWDIMRDHTPGVTEVENEDILEEYDYIDLSEGEAM